MRMATWNVRIMCPELSDDLQQVNYSRKTAAIDSQLRRLHIYIAAHEGDQACRRWYCMLWNKNYIFI